jgi:hypothetical protein
VSISDKNRRTHIDSQFSAFHNALSRGPKMTKEWCQKILDELSMKELSILSAEALASRFEKLVKKSIINPRYGKKNWTEEETEFLVSVVAYYTHIWSLDYQSLVNLDLINRI